MYKSLKKKLKQFPAIVKLIRAVLKFFGPKCLVDERYFQRKFLAHQNFESLTFESGLVTGYFKDISYLIKIHPKNRLESFVYLDGIWEPHIAQLISGYLIGSQHSVIDVGANIGATSIPLAKYFHKTNFYLFEPHPLVYDDLINNISYNNLGNVVAKNIAITDSTEQSLPFYAQKNATNLGLSSFMLNDDIDEFDVINVDCQSLDSIFLNSNKKIDVIKIDTQGHELNVLLSATNIIQRDRPIIFFEYESEYFKNKIIESTTRKNIVKFFERMNYELYMIDPSSKYLPKITLKNYYHGDIIAVPLAKVL